MKIVRVICLALLLAGCSRETPPLPGGGPRCVSGILLMDRENRTLLRENNRRTLRVGESLPLRVLASWSIPYVGDETVNASFSVSDAAVAELGANGVLTALKPGSVTITAELRISRDGTDTVLNPAEPAGATPAVLLRDTRTITVAE